MGTQYRIFLQNPNDGQWYPFGPPFAYMTAAELWMRKSTLNPCDYVVKPVLEGEAPFVAKS
jgi:hypothetical protein